MFLSSKSSENTLIFLVFSGIHSNISLTPRNLYIKIRPLVNFNLHKWNAYMIMVTTTAVVNLGQMCSHVHSQLGSRNGHENNSLKVAFSIIIGCARKYRFNIISITLLLHCYIITCRPVITLQRLLFYCFRILYFIWTISQHQWFFRVYGAMAMEFDGCHHHGCVWDNSKHRSSAGKYTTNLPY